MILLKNEFKYNGFGYGSSSGKVGMFFKIRRKG